MSLMKAYAELYLVWALRISNRNRDTQRAVTVTSASRHPFTAVVIRSSECGLRHTMDHLLRTLLDN